MNTQSENSQDVISPAGDAAIFMIFNLTGHDTSYAPIKDLCGELANLVKSLRKRFPHDNVNAVMGFGAKAWETLFKGLPRPSELHPFEEIKGAKHIAPSTPGDIFFHIRASRMDLSYELASTISLRLQNVVTPVEEIQGFRYFDGRTIIGFVDGTENPEIDEAENFAVIGDEDPYFKGGSYAFTQKYLHDMQSWNNLSTEQQELVIGRRKLNDNELSDEEKPENAHNAVTNIEDENGNELKIMRANMPFASPSRNEYGTFFIGYARSFTVTKRMLDNMFIGEPEGNYDRLLDFSTAVTGTLFFIPSPELLEDLADVE